VSGQGRLLALGRTGNDSTVLAVHGILDDSLLFFWNNDGNPTWNSSIIDGPGNVVAAPALARTGNNSTVIATQGPNNSLNFYWNSDGDPDWNKTVIAKSGTAYSAPALCRTDNGVTIAMCQGPNNALVGFYNNDGQQSWTPISFAEPASSSPAVQDGPVVAAISVPASGFKGGPGDPSHDIAIGLYGGAQNRLGVVELDANEGYQGIYYESLTDGVGTPALVFNVSNNWPLVACRRPDNGLQWFWSEAPVPLVEWETAEIAPAGTTYSDPSVWRTDHNSTVIAAVGPNNSLNFYWNNDGDKSWPASQIAGSGTSFSAPAVGRTDHETTIVAIRGPNNQILFYSNADGDSTWNSSVIGSLEPG
jgi:hypothetical protein